MFVAYYCEGCSAAPLTQHKNNEIKQELEKEKYYFGGDSDEILYTDMRCSKWQTDKLKKLTRDDGGVTLTNKLKNQQKKNECDGCCLFTDSILVYQHK